MRRRAGIVPLAVTLALAFGLASCGGPSSPPTPAPSPAPSTPATPGPASPLPAAQSPSPAPATPQSASPAPAGVTQDPALLDVLPPEVGGTQIVLEDVAFEEAATDPDFSANVGSAAFFVAAGPEDLASGVVARLRPGAYSDAFYRDWRDSYDQGACAQAGGVAGNAEAELGGRTVHITRCAGGLLAYHAYLPDDDLAISVIAVGEGRFGEQLMEALEP